MMEFDDCRWDGLKGGYRIPFDPRPLLIKLEAGQDTEAVWDELWQESHHQGDVGEASFAMVPHLVKIVRNGGAPGQNAYAIVGTIELRRNEGGNPDVPDWLREDYFDAIRDLAAIALSRIDSARDPEEIKVMLSTIAMEKGLREHARFLLQYSEEELQQMDFPE